MEPAVFGARASFPRGASMSATATLAPMQSTAVGIALVAGDVER
jgi:hypothetical protein